MSWALLWRLRKPIGIAAGLLALFAAVGWQVHAFGERAEERGRAEIRDLWQADTLARDAVNAAELARQAADREVQRKANDAILEDYNAKLLAAAGDRDNYFRLLQRARGEVHSLAAGQATGARIAATAGEAGIAERIDRAVAGVIVEARANADQLDAVIAVIKPQVAP
jgi:hypothetical protein